MRFGNFLSTMENLTNFFIFPSSRPRDEAQETITEVQNKASASLAEIMAAEEPHVEVTAERQEK